jgi:hypothetical protein
MLVMNKALSSIDSIARYTLNTRDGETGPLALTAVNGPSGDELVATMLRHRSSEPLWVFMLTNRT